MKTTQFTEDAGVKAAIDQVKTICANKQFSDVIDAAGHQYVDLVMEGGGVLGIALVGFTYVLEQAGIRFLGIGGTSAGSINALLLAALGPPASAKAERMVELLADTPLPSFIDGDDDARDFCAAALANKSLWKLAWKGVQVMDNLTDDLGLNPGRKFEEWLGQVLRDHNVHCHADIDRLLTTTPDGIRQRDGGEPAQKVGSLALVAADVTTETKVDFPRMACLYWDDPMQVPPEKFARASMSIPLFFHPMRVQVPKAREREWHALAQFKGTPPDEVLFVDGGIMSNFPIDLFHNKSRVPSAPTFGAKIGADRNVARRIGSPGALLGAIFDSARHTLDYDFVKRNPDYRFLVSEIDTGEHNWLNFNLPDAAKIDLFRRGARCAAQFLCGFDWANYKNVRKLLVDAHKAGGTADTPSAADRTAIEPPPAAPA